MKHIVFLAYGTRGDVQPYVTLGLALQARGYRVSIAASEVFASWVDELGLDFLPLSFDIIQMMHTEDAKKWASYGSKPLLGLRWAKRLAAKYASVSALELINYARDADLAISSVTAIPFGDCAAERYGVKHMAAILFPIAPTGDPRAVAVPFRPKTYSRLNWFSCWISEWILWWMSKDVLKTIRAEIGLPPINRQTLVSRLRQIPTIHGISEHVVPRPKDWPPHVHNTGYWFLDENGWTPPQDLLDFLDADAPPIYVGFGSMSSAHDPKEITRIIVRALEQTGQRGVLLGGWAGLGEDIPLPPTVYRVDSAPHSWLFPRMAAIVHHGGAGTTAAGLRAGRPNIVVPHLGDQPFWGRRVYELGVGTKPIFIDKLNVKRLAKAIQQAVSDTAMQARAAQLGEQIRRENGVQVAVDIIERYLAG